MVERVDQYVRDVLGEHVAAGPYVRAQAQRHLDDLDAGHWIWDEQAAEDVLRFYPGMLSLTGEETGQPFRLLDWQSFVVGSIFGWKDPDTGQRRFRRAYIEGSRGCGKTPLAAGMAIYMLLFDRMPAAEVYICAASLTQSKITFADVQSMIEESAYLTSRTKVQSAASEAALMHPASRSKLRALAYRTSGQGLSGLRPHCAVIDELHEHPTDVMLMRMVKGFKRDPRPLLIITTNSGFDRLSVCYEERRKAIAAAEGESELARTFGYVCAVDEGEDPLEEDQEDCLLKVNPSMSIAGRTDPKADDGLPSWEYLRDARTEALQTPRLASEFLRFNACTWTTTSVAWLQRGVWEGALRAGEGLRIEDYAGEDAWIGGHLAMRRAMCALVLLFRSPDPQFKYDVFAQFWIAGANLGEAERRDHREGLYTLWQKQGFLRAFGQSSINYEDIARTIAEYVRTYRIQGMAYDRLYADVLQNELDRLSPPADVELFPHPQGFAAAVRGSNTEGKLYTPLSIKRTEMLLRRGEVRVAPNPILTDHVTSAMAEVKKVDAAADPTTHEEIKLTSASPGEFVDGAIGLIQGLGLAESGLTEPTVWSAVA